MELDAIAVFEQTRKYRPYEFIYEDGWDDCLVATQPILSGSLLCEYLGQFKRITRSDEKNPECEFFEIGFDLESKPYGIFTERMCNEARYIKNIGHKMECQQNCETVILMVDKVPRVFIYASKGKRIYK